MDFKVFLTSKKMTITEFAKKHGISRQYLYNMIAGRRRYTHKIAEIIEESTNGIVSYYDLRGMKRPRGVKRSKK